MSSIAPRLENLQPDVSWHQELINEIAPYNLVKSGLLSGKPHIPPVNRPERLYRYSSYKKEYIEMACSNNLHLSLPSQVNDPYDLYANIDATKILEWLAPIFGQDSCSKFISVLMTGKFQAHGHILQRFFNNIQYTCNRCITDLMCTDLNECINFIFKSDFKNVMRYVSFSENHDSPPMWAYYANSHRGYCLEYTMLDDAWSLRSSDAGQLYSVLIPVVYTERPFDGNEYLRNTNINKIDISKIEAYGFALMAILCLQKIFVWSHEREWRLILSTDRSEPCICKDISPVRLSAIHAGIKMSDRDIKELTMTAGQYGIPVYRMGVHKDTFQLCSERDVPTKAIFAREYSSE